jgi:hypothetical protein
MKTFRGGFRVSTDLQRDKRTGLERAVGSKVRTPDGTTFRLDAFPKRITDVREQGGDIVVEFNSGGSRLLSREHDALREAGASTGTGSMGGNDPAAHGKIRYIVRAFGSWANGKHHVCVRRLTTEQGWSAERANRTCAWMKDQWTGSTKWRGPRSSPTQRAENNALEKKARATAYARFTHAMPSIGPDTLERLVEDVRKITGTEPADVLREIAGERGDQLVESAGDVFVAIFEAERDASAAAIAETTARLQEVTRDRLGNLHDSSTGQFVSHGAVTRARADRIAAGSALLERLKPWQLHQSRHLWSDGRVLIPPHRFNGLPRNKPELRAVLDEIEAHNASIREAGVTELLESWLALHGDGRAIRDDRDDVALAAQRAITGSGPPRPRSDTDRRVLEALRLTFQTGHKEPSMAVDEQAPRSAVTTITETAAGSAAQAQPRARAVPDVIVRLPPASAGPRETVVVEGATLEVGELPPARIAPGGDFEDLKDRVRRLYESTAAPTPDGRAWITSAGRMDLTRAAATLDAAFREARSRIAAAERADAALREGAAGEHRSSSCRECGGKLTEAGGCAACESARESSWVAEAIGEIREGQLHRDLGVDEAAVIPVKTLEAAAAGTGPVARRARVALTLRRRRPARLAPARAGRPLLQEGETLEEAALRVARNVLTNEGGENRGLPRARTTIVRGPGGGGVLERSLRIRARSGPALDDLADFLPNPTADDAIMWARYNQIREAAYAMKAAGISRDLIREAIAEQISAKRERQSPAPIASRRSPLREGQSIALQHRGVLREGTFVGPLDDGERAVVEIAGRKVAVPYLALRVKRADLVAAAL